MAKSGDGEDNQRNGASIVLTRKQRKIWHEEGIYLDFFLISGFHRTSRHREKVKGSVFFYSSLREVSLGQNPNFLNSGSHDIVL